MNMAAGIHSIGDYERYLDCFNRQDVACFTSFYNDDFEFIATGFPHLKGKNAMVEFYRNAWSHFSEHLTVRHFAIKGDTVEVFLENHITVFKDFPDFPPSALRKGQHVLVSGKVTYVLRHGRISRILDVDPEH